MDITVAGAAAVIDYIFLVEELPQPGQIKAILRGDGRTGTPYCGGGAPNTACVLVQFGHDVNLIYPVGEDFPGSACERAWCDLGINMDGVDVVPGKQSGFAFLFSQRDGQSMCFAYAGAADGTVVSEIRDLGEIVVIAPVLNAFSKQVLEVASKQKRNVILSGISSPQVSKYFDSIDTMIINSTEVTELCSTLGFEGPEQLASELKGRRLYVTHGKSGSVIYYDDTIARIPTIAAPRFLDPTGAGDAYTAGVVHGLASGKNSEVAGLIGAAAASFAVQDYGGQSNLPTWEQLKQRLEEQNPELAGQL